MKLTGLHLLLTYRCDRECDHCFVWGGPEQSGTMTLATIREILRQATELRTIEWIYFEGGEPFLYYPILREGVHRASRNGFRVGIVTNGYWATSEEDAVEWLRPLAGRVQDLSVSGDAFHGSESAAIAARLRAVAGRLGIPADVIAIGDPDQTSVSPAVGQLPAGESGVMFRGRAVDKLAPRAAARPWQEFTSCPWEDLRDPGRVHVDPFGNVHLCQGLSLGNLNRRPLVEICRAYDPDADPVVGALIAGGPAELARRHGVRRRERYADACHLCYESRVLLRDRFPEALVPDQMYGVRESA